MRISTLWTGAILLCAGVVSGQGKSTPFFVDHASFMARDNFAFTEFYVQVGHNRLRFTRHDNSYRAVYDLELYVEDQDENLVLTQSARDTVRVSSYDETIRADHYRVTLLNSYLKPGRYRLRTILTDKETDESAEVKQEISINDFSSRALMISNLQFSRHIKPDTSASPFVKHDCWIEPNVLHLYGQFADALYLYYEIYNLSPPTMTNGAVALSSADVTAEKKYAAADSFQVLFIMQDKEGRALKQIRKASRKPGTSCVQSVILPVANLPSGEYTLKVRVSDPGNGASAEVSGQFNMYWHPLSLKDYKLEEILEQLHLIASRDEMRELSRLPEAEQLQGIFEFWKRRDPTPGTLQNEAMDEYYRRVDYAERHFTGKGRGRQGWKSPQGKIYLAYGAPDEIHRFTNSTTYQAIDGGMRRVFPAQNQPWRSSSVGTGRYSQLNDDGPHEVWKYHQLNREFIFVDKHGTGSYELIDPMFLN